MNMSEVDKQIVEELCYVMRKHRSIGAIRMAECIRLVFEKEVGYITHKNVPKFGLKTRSEGWKKHNHTKNKL